MEELIVRFYWECGQVHLDKLPSTMHILFLHSEVHVNCQVNFANLPEGLVQAWIVPKTEQTNVTLKVCGKAKPDQRVKICPAVYGHYGSDFGSVVELSKYFCMCDRFKG